jgi:hypothetical protein
MANATLKHMLEEIKTLQPEELRLLGPAVQSQMAPGYGHENTGANAWDVLEHFTVAVDAPIDWADNHDYYLSGAPKRSITDPT